MAVGISGSLPLAELRIGTKWSVLTVPLPAGTFAGSLPRFHATQRRPVPPSAFLISASASLPMAGTEQPGVSSTVPLPLYTTPGDLRSVSCFLVNVCVAVGGAYVYNVGEWGLVEVWNGFVMDAKTVPNPTLANDKSGDLTGVSCTSIYSCVAVGIRATSAPYSDVLSGTSWKLHFFAPPTAIPADAITAVSCLSASYCLAAGTNTTAGSGAAPLAESWNGNAWAVQPTQNPTGSIDHDSSGRRALLRRVAMWWGGGKTARP